MSSSVTDFETELDQDVELDMSKLADMAQHGVPAELRGRVWALLLGATQFEKHASGANVAAKDYEELIKSGDVALQKKVSRYLTRYARQNRVFANEANRRLMQNIVIAHSNSNTEVEFEPGQLFLLAQLVPHIKSEPDLFNCYMSILQAVDRYFGPNNIDKMVAKLMAVFRTLLPELYAHFEEEEVSPNSWVVSWLRHLLASQLPPECVSRLWDVYFACDEGLSLHIYVCVALLREAREVLLELDGEALTHALSRHPATDVGRLVAQAYNLKQEAESSEL